MGNREIRVDAITEKVKSYILAELILSANDTAGLEAVKSQIASTGVSLRFDSIIRETLEKLLNKFKTETSNMAAGKTAKPDGGRIVAGFKQEYQNEQLG